ncbi:MAG: GntR family transcriptional regulator [Desulfobacterales bacterium]|nr:GntR family transcriptional regulator [Desulfobacterales bacterium]
MADIGRINTLTVKKKADAGALLDGGLTGEILLPKKYVSRRCKPGDTLDVFVYVDREKRLQATLKKPYATVGQVAQLQVVATSVAGAYLDWGLDHDLFVPRGEQPVLMEKGEAHVVFLFLDERTRRVTASSRLDQFLGLSPPEYDVDAVVDLFICEQSDLGYKAVVDNTHWGFIYKNEVFQELKPGQQLKGYIKSIRPDLKIDIRLQQSGTQGIDTIANSILQVIANHGSRLAVTDKSPPDKIYALFGVSKKRFKKAIGALYKRRLITIGDSGISLSKKSD